MGIAVMGPASIPGKDGNCEHGQREAVLLVAIGSTWEQALVCRLDGSFDFVPLMDVKLTVQTAPIPPQESPSAKGSIVTLEDLLRRGRP